MCCDVLCSAVQWGPLHPNKYSTSRRRDSRKKSRDGVKSCNQLAALRKISTPRVPLVSFLVFSSSNRPESPLWGSGRSECVARARVTRLSVFRLISRVQVSVLLPLIWLIRSAKQFGSTCRRSTRLVSSRLRSSLQPLCVSRVRVAALHCSAYRLYELCKTKCEYESMWSRTDLKSGEEREKLSGAATWRISFRNIVQCSLALLWLPKGHWPGTQQKREPNEDTLVRLDCTALRRSASELPAKGESALRASRIQN